MRPGFPARNEIPSSDSGYLPDYTANTSASTPSRGPGSSGGPADSGQVELGRRSSNAAYTLFGERPVWGFNSLVSIDDKPKQSLYLNFGFSVDRENRAILEHVLSGGARSLEMNRSDDNSEARVTDHLFDYQGHKYLISLAFDTQNMVSDCQLRTRPRIVQAPVTSEVLAYQNATAFTGRELALTVEMRGSRDNNLKLKVARPVDETVDTALTELEDYMLDDNDVTLDKGRVFMEGDVLRHPGGKLKFDFIHDDAKYFFDFAFNDNGDIHTFSLNKKTPRLEEDVQVLIDHTREKTELARMQAKTREDEKIRVQAEEKARQDAIQLTQMAAATATLQQKIDTEREARQQAEDLARSTLSDLDRTGTELKGKLADAIKARQKAEDEVKEATSNSAKSASTLQKRLEEESDERKLAEIKAKTALDSLEQTRKSLLNKVEEAVQAKNEFEKKAQALTSDHERTIEELRSSLHDMRDAKSAAEAQVIHAKEEYAKKEEALKAELNARIEEAVQARLGQIRSAEQMQAVSVEEDQEDFEVEEIQADAARKRQRIKTEPGVSSSRKTTHANEPTGSSYRRRSSSFRMTTPASSITPSFGRFGTNHIPSYIKQTFAVHLNTMVVSGLEQGDDLTEAQKQENTYKLSWVLPVQRRFLAALVQTAYDACKQLDIEINEDNAHQVMERAVVALRSLSRAEQRKIDSLLARPQKLTNDSSPAPPMSEVMDGLPETYTPLEQVNNILANVCSNIHEINSELTTDVETLRRYCMSPSLLKPLFTLHIDTDNPLLAYMEETDSETVLLNTARAWDYITRDKNPDITPGLLKNMMSRLWDIFMGASLPTSTHRVQFPPENNNSTALMQYAVDRPYGTLTDAGQAELQAGLTIWAELFKVKMVWGSPEDADDSAEYGRPVKTLGRSDVPVETITSMLKEIAAKTHGIITQAGRNNEQLLKAEARLAISLTQHRVLPSWNVHVGMMMINFLRLHHLQSVPFALPNADQLDGHGLSEIVYLMKNQENQS